MGASLWYPAPTSCRLLANYKRRPNSKKKSAHLLESLMLCSKCLTPSEVDNSAAATRIGQIVLTTAQPKRFGTEL